MIKCSNSLQISNEFSSIFKWNSNYFIIQLVFESIFSEKNNNDFLLVKRYSYYYDANYWISSLTYVISNDSTNLLKYYYRLINNG